MSMRLILREAQICDATGIYEIMVQGWIHAFSNFLDSRAIQRIQNENNASMIENIIKNPSIKIIAAESIDDNQLLGYCAYDTSKQQAASRINIILCISRSMQ